MDLHGLIYSFPKYYKNAILAFVIMVNIGFFTGLFFIEDTTNFESVGIQEQYLGNENIADAVEMKFKKPQREMLTLIHNHILSLSILFFMMASLLAITGINKKVKAFLMIEPFISLLLTFGGLYIIWSGVAWFSYIVMISGTLMTLSFLAESVIIIKELLDSTIKCTS
ncbi:MAG: hypothetical protein HQ471_01350, partial [Flavobacteriales bacterium]|nr:hypothetical protein [Flavobacteriales bacterium]